MCRYENWFPLNGANDLTSGVLWCANGFIVILFLFYCIVCSDHAFFVSSDDVLHPTSVAFFFIFVVEFFHHESSRYNMILCFVFMPDVFASFDFGFLIPG
jgi:hypothetical protein